VPEVDDHIVLEQGEHMIRHLAVAAGALAMLSSAAMAETTVVTRSSPHYVTPHHVYVAPGHKTKVVKHRVNRYGQLVTVKKTYRDGFSGSSVSKSKTITDPHTGTTTKTRTTVQE
jgi:hypothetical protein